jgi:hemolysin activation/secretion protein
MRGRALELVLTLLLAVPGFGLAPDSARAQINPQRPGDIRPELPPIEEPKRPEFELPPLPERPEEKGRLSGQPQLVVREFRVTGSTVFSDEELRAVTAPYTNRPITAEDLHELRNKLTLLYVNKGYVNSGAVLPDQTVADGIVEYRIVEGRLDQIEVEGNRWFRTGYLRDRLELGAKKPLNVRDLEHELQILQQDERIRRVNAQLGPGTRPGDGVLRVRFEEEPPYRAWFDFSNYEPPSVGAYRSQLRLAHQNLTGNGDTLDLRAALTDGFEEYEVAYEIPLNRWDTALTARFLYDGSDVIDPPFDDDDPDIRSESTTTSLGVNQPVYRSLNSQVELSASLDYRTSETFLLGRRFSFPPLPARDDGKTQITALRLAQSWIFRDLKQVVAMRSQFSIGLDIFGATMHGSYGCCEEIPDGEYFAWLGQFQWVRRFDPWGVQLVLRTDLQLAEDPLLSLEQFSIGGHSTVRGYRENELVRDNGVVSSVELRIPLWADRPGRPTLQLAPFFDWGNSWNTDRPELGPETLMSAGVGLRFAFTRHLEAQIYWGEELRKVPDPPNRDLQDAGVQFQLVLAY